LKLHNDKKPNFIVIGSPRCGTTWLYRCLKEHPDVFLPEIKELDFFNNNYNKGKGWYLDIFKYAGNKKAIGDVSPEYILSLEAPERIKQHFPEIKLILIMRNPVERAYSEFKLRKRHGMETRDFDVALDEDLSYVSKGLYYKHLCRYLKYFPLNRICCIKYDNICSNPGSVMQKLFQFLDVNNEFIPNFLHRRTTNASMPPPRFKRLDKLLINIRLNIDKTDIGKRLLWLLRDSGLIHMIHQVNSINENEKQYDYKKLIKYFDDDIKNLSNLLYTNINWTEEIRTDSIN